MSAPTDTRELLHRLVDALDLLRETSEHARAIALELADRAGHGPHPNTAPAGCRQSPKDQAMQATHSTELPPEIEAAITEHVDALPAAARRALVHQAIEQGVAEVAFAAAIVALERGDAQSAYSKLCTVAEHFIATQPADELLKRVRQHPTGFAALCAGEYPLPANA